MGKKEAAQRKTFKGHYRGPERFKGDKTKIAAWKAEKAKGNPNPGMASGPESYDTAGNVIPVASSTTATNPAPVKPEKADAPANTFNPASAMNTVSGMTQKYAGATRKFKGTYAGPDKYKGLAPAGGKWKGKYIGAEKRKGVAKPTVTPSVAGSSQDAVMKRLLDAKNAS
jgi:hypothetical protein